MINFKNSTFICLDFPLTMVEKIKSIRQNLDSKIAWKPVVITLAGSSGCGHISDKQDILEANEIISRLVENIPPIKLQFSNINSFKGTNIFFFEFQEEKLLTEIHYKIKKCGIKFYDNEYPFKPHCTIHFNGEISNILKQKIKNTVIPKDEFIIDTLSFISKYEYLSKFRLNGHV
ncbi:MAG: 2'-5' RNA ligase family protein [Candidatus Neomarinimicrobiota bacterium]|nr:2'-5' RNA ligase family protein [Candidatus Neomarinimicrobiota bacterium]